MTTRGPVEPITIDPPPRLPTADGAAAIATSAIPMLGSMGSVALVASLGSGSSAVRLVAAGLFLVTTVAYLGLQLDRQRVQRRRQVDGRRRSYLRHLAVVRSALRDAAARQRAGLLARHPPPAALPAVAEERSGVWAGRSGDAPLDVRYGVRAGPLAVELVVPDDLDADDADPVAVAAVRRLVAAHRGLPDLPAVADLHAVRRIAVSGDVHGARSTVRAVVCSAAVAHPPDELVVAVCASDEARSAWEWVKWLPHAHSPERSDAVGGLRMVVATVDDLLPLLPAGGHRLLIVDGVPAPAALVATTVVEVGVAGAAPSAGTLVVGDGEGDLRPDALDAATAEAVARRLLPRGGPPAARERSATSAPDLVAMLGTAGVSRLDPLRAWRGRAPGQRLAVPIGAADDGTPVRLDLKESAHGGMGPHGLLVGATGSGKSELLRTLVLGLAMTHGPDRLNLVLADFKGGATFAGMADLPQVAAVITNLADDLALVDRMEDALAGEMVRRQELLRAAGNLASVHDHEAAREQGAALEPLPSLLVVVDEFSELLSAKPDLTELFVAIGRLGRSLGIHLLLASQRLEEGRLRGLDAHLSYRIGLRTFSAQESRAVLGAPDAYALPALPGLGYLKPGPGSMVRFRSAYVSGPEAPRTRGPGLQVLPFAAREVRAETRLAPPPRGSLRSVLDVATSRLRGHGPAPHRLWLPPLDRPEPLTALLHRAGRLRLPVGVVDRPREQRCDPLVLDLSGSAGHVAVVGGPRSGRSTLLRTIVTASALTTTPLETQWFVFDLGGSLSSLARLPHVAALAGRADADVLRRAVAELLDLADRREAAGRDDRYGEVFLCVDGWGVLRDDHDDHAAAIQQLAQRGLGVGIHLVASAARWSDFRAPLRDQLGTRLELRLGDPVDSEVDRKAAATVPVGRPGRGLVPGPLHFLAALPPDEPDIHWDGPAPPRLRLLPERVALDDVRRLAGPDAPGLLLGLDEARLAPVALDPATDPHLLVFGDGRSGKTALLRTYLHEVVRTQSPEAAQVVVVDYRRSLLDEVPRAHLLHHLASDEEVRPAIEELARYLRSRLPGPGVSAAELRRRSRWRGAEVHVVVDDHDLVAGGQGSPLVALQPLLAQAADVGLHLVVARRSGGAARALFEPLLQTLRDLAAPGVLLSGSRDEGPLVGGVRPEPAPPGRARLVTRDHGTRVVQVALAPSREGPGAAVVPKLRTIIVLELGGVPMPVPVVLLCGVEPAAMASTMVGMLFDLPDAVAVHHDIDVDRQVLTRTVSDLSGIVERQEIELDHACVACAIREDIVPTLVRLARSGQWATVVARLPVGAEPTQVCRVLSWDSRVSPLLRVSAVVAALSAADPVGDLLDDDLLAERGAHTAHDDRRGVGEVVAAMVEYADAVTFDQTPDPVARGLVAALARPGVPLSEGTAGLLGTDLSGNLHQHERTERWTSPTRTEALPHLVADGVWRLDLQSLQPFHPQRLLDSIGLLGSGRHRSRGCFWLPTRPRRATGMERRGLPAEHRRPRRLGRSDALHADRCHRRGLRAGPPGRLRVDAGRGRAADRPHAHRRRLAVDRGRVRAMAGTDPRRCLAELEHVIVRR